LTSGRAYHDGCPDGHVTERDGVSRRTGGAAPLEEGDAYVAVEARGNPDGAGASVE
jgi:hypothetical protein